MDPAHRPGWPRRLVRGLFGVLAAVWILLEEWLWDGLKRCMQWLGRLPIVRSLEARIARAGPKTAIALFLIPWLLLLPAKLLAFWLIGTGHAGAGLLVFVAAKLLGTALLARLFTLTRPALLTIVWFRRLHDWFLTIKLRLFAYVRGLRVVIWVKAISARLRAALKGIWRRLHGVPPPPG
jgi:hypothetical protein